MYEIALSVQSCLSAETEVHVAWVVAGIPFDGTQAVALTPGGGRMGNLLDGAIDHLLVEAANKTDGDGQLVAIPVGPVEALLTGLREGSELTVAVAPGTAFPAEVWQAFADREAAAFEFDREGSRLVAGRSAEPIGTHAELTDDRLMTSLIPMSQVVVAGGGPIAEAVVSAFAFVGWQASAISDVTASSGVMATLGVGDAVVVIGHDLEISGVALQAAIRSKAGYIGSVGSPEMQSRRRDWLGYRGVKWDERVHGPAGIDIGASSPEQIAVSIVAECLGATAS